MRGGVRSYWIYRRIYVINTYFKLCTMLEYILLNIKHNNYPNLLLTDWEIFKYITKNVGLRVLTVRMILGELRSVNIEILHARLDLTGITSETVKQIMIAYYSSFLLISNHYYAKKRKLWTIRAIKPWCFKFNPISSSHMIILLNLYHFGFLNVPIRKIISYLFFHLLVFFFFL